MKLQDIRTRIETYLNGQSEYDRKAVIPSYHVAACFLCIHILMFLFFLFFRVTPMAIFNIFSILFYAFTFWLIKKDQMFLFSTLTYIEVLLHMFLAVVFVGWKSGFQTTLIGIIVMIFYSEYVGKDFGRKHSPAMAMSLMAMIAYIIAYVITESRPAPYSLPHQAEYILTIMWAATTFVIAMIFLQVFVDLTVSSELKLKEERSHDALTGLYNRYFMIGHLDNLMKQEGEKKHWLAIADLDDFKHVNDTYGHNCGDYVLRTMAELFREHLPDVEICRWGGEEFLMAGAAETDGWNERQKLEELCRRIRDYDFCYEEQHLHLTVTIGFAMYRNESRQETWISRADDALYKGKCAGKDQVYG